MSVCIGDIIELEPDSVISKLAKIIDVKKAKIEAIDLSCGKLIIIPTEELFDKQEVTGLCLTPIEEKQLVLLKAKNLWIKLNPIEYKEYKEQKTKTDNIKIKEKQIEEDQLKFLKNLFKKEEIEKEEIENISFFKKEDEKSVASSPLKRFIKKNE